MQQFSAALVGLGNIAWRFDGGRISADPSTHLGAYRSSGNVKVICGYSPIEQERQKFEGSCHVPSCEEFHHILEANPDIVSICSPSEAHFEQALMCLEHKIPMLWLEKPPTIELTELDKLIECARGGATKVLVNYMRRYSPSYERLTQVYQQGLLGKPLRMHVLYSRGLETNGSHFLDYVFSMKANEPAPDFIMSTSKADDENPDFVLRFKDGFTVTFLGFPTAYHINDVVLTCEEGRVSLASGGAEPRVEQKVPNQNFPGFFRLSETTPSLLTEGPPSNPFIAALRDLIDAHHRGVQPRSNLQTARRTQAIIHAVRTHER